MGNCCCFCGTGGQELDYAGSNVHVVQDKTSWDEKIAESTKENKLVVVNFTASWCGPCKNSTRFYIELAKKYPNHIFLSVDIDDLGELVSTYSIGATPTFVFMKGGKRLDKLVGGNQEELEKKLEVLTRSL
ncbi:hypothetical protein LUZ60_011041 [Juncus effusus]|nr:hypothetical protein LUZ60_011041 [Juncus effusus]